MTKSSDLWYEMMMDKLDTDREGVKQYMVQKAKDAWEKPSRRAHKHRGGFSDKKFAREMGAKGKATRWGSETTKGKVD